MKRVIAVLLAALLLSLAGCAGPDEEAAKLCRIEITDLTGEHAPAVLEDLSQEEAGAFLFEGDWDQTEPAPAEGLTPRYVVSVYQDATRTVLGENDGELLKILEYVTYEDTDLVKCTVGADFLPEKLVEGFLEVYDTAPPEFFAALNEALSE